MRNATESEDRGMSGPENPRAYPGGNPSRYDGKISDGMTLRDWFAGQALAGVIGYANQIKSSVDKGKLAGAIAHDAYTIADAMLAARNTGARS